MSSPAPSSASSPVSSSSPTPSAPFAPRPAVSPSVLALRALAGRLDMHADLVDRSVLEALSRAHGTRWESDAGRSARGRLEDATARMRADAASIRTLAESLRRHVAILETVPRGVGHAAPPAVRREGLRG